MAVIVLFAVVNTMTMNVLERTSEIGTIRAMECPPSQCAAAVPGGGRSASGAFGASLGVVVAFIAIALINHGGFRWTPPGNTDAIPFQLARPELAPVLLLGTWLGLVLVATSWLRCRRRTERRKAGSWMRCVMYRNFTRQILADLRRDSPLPG